MHNDPVVHSLLAATPAEGLAPPVAARRGATLAIVSCTGPTQPFATRARDHFTAPLFQALCAFAEREAGRTFLLSAEYGLLDPETVIAPSRTVLDRKDVKRLQAWAGRVIEQLAPHLAGIERVILLANARSREHLIDFLRQDGRTVDVPLEGLSLGEQLHWLRRHGA